MVFAGSSLSTVEGFVKRNGGLDEGSIFKFICFWTASAQK
jgi:hypothetical protein